MLADIRRFIEEQVWPLDVPLLRLPFRHARQHLAPLRDHVRKAGWWAPPLPRAWGGQGLSLYEFAPISEVLGTSPFGHWLFNCQAPDIGNMELLLAHGTDEQRERFLRPLVAGDVHSCFAMTEPENAGSNPTLLDTTARREGDDYVLDGHKWFTTAADGAAFAIVMAVTHADRLPHQRASQIIVPCETPGFELVRSLAVMGEAGQDAASHCEVRLGGCRVPVANRLGPEGEGFVLAQERLGPGRIHHCMRWIGIAERAFHLMCQRAASRTLSPGHVLAEQQTVQHWIAESRAEIDASRLYVLDTARRIDSEGAASVRESISTIKFFVAGMLGRVLDRAIQVHGAYGLTDETPLSWWYRHERGARIYDGPDEVHKNLVARSILKRYGARL